MRRSRSARAAVRAATVATVAALAPGATVALALVGTHCYFVSPYADLTSGSAPDGDAGGSGDARGGQFCKRLAPTPTFCRDFDEGEPVGTGFTFVGASPGGTLDVDPAVSVSSTSSLHCAVPATAGGGPLEYVAEDVVVTRSLHVELDALADGLGSATDEVTLLAISGHDAAGVQRSLLYYTTRTGAELEEESTPPFMNWPKPLPAPPELGKWTHYALDLVLAGDAPARVTLAVDGKKVLDDAALGQPWPAGGYRVSFGLSWINASRAAWSFHDDDLVIVAR
ncbi:MAG: hypothetical protein NVS3B10_31530 [Polyangiales bacterium]